MTRMNAAANRWKHLAFYNLGLRNHTVLYRCCNITVSSHRAIEQKASHIFSEVDKFVNICS
jgi:hypothetical protein